MPGHGAETRPGTRGRAAGHATKNAATAAGHARRAAPGTEWARAGDAAGDRGARRAADPRPAR